MHGTRILFALFLLNFSLALRIIFYFSLFIYFLKNILALHIIFYFSLFFWIFISWLLLLIPHSNFPFLFAPHIVFIRPAFFLSYSPLRLYLFFSQISLSYSSLRLCFFAPQISLQSIFILLSNFPFLFAPQFSLSYSPLRLLLFAPQISLSFSPFRIFLFANFSLFIPQISPFDCQISLKFVLLLFHFLFVL